MIIYMYIYIYIYIWGDNTSCICLCWLCTSVDVYVYVCVRMFVRMCTHGCVFVYVRAGIPTFVHTHFNKHCSLCVTYYRLVQYYCNK